jgi:hypothetical protein
MTKMFISFFLLVALLLQISPAIAQQDIPRNIRLDIVIKKAGYVQSGAATKRFQEETKQFITTLDGREATIFIGKNIPQRVPLRRYLVDHDYLEESTVRFVDVGTRIRAIPRVVGNNIEVEITPEISFQTAAEGEKGIIQVRHLSSTVLVPDGGTIQLGSFSTDSEFYNHFYRNARGERVMVTLSPRVLT